MVDEREIIVVTGCSGRVGHDVIAALHNQYRIVGLDMQAPKTDADRMDFMMMDVTSDEQVRNTFNKIREKYGPRIASCIHLAAYYSFSEGDPKLYEAITVQGTRRILGALQESQVDQFLFSSTQLVHAPCEVGEKVNEESLVDPKWAYPQSKVRTEEIIAKDRGSIPTVILRIAGCYDDTCRSIPISNQIQRIYEKQLGYQLYPGDITHGAVFLHFEDLVNAIELAVQQRKNLPDSVTLLIGEERIMSYDAMQKTISMLLFGEPLTTYTIPKWVAKLGAWGQNHNPFGEPAFIQPWMIDLADDHYELDVSLARKVLGWTPKHFVGDSLPKMIALLKENPAEFYRINGLKAPKHFPEFVTSN